MNYPENLDQAHNDANGCKSPGLRVADAIMRAKDLWLSRVMKLIMPPEVFEAHFYVHKAHGRKVVARWCQENNVKWGDVSVVTVAEMNGKVVAEFRVRFEDGKVMFEERMPPDPAGQTPANPIPSPTP